MATSTTLVTKAGIGAAIRYGSIASSGGVSYGAKLQISRVVAGSTTIQNLNSSITSIPGIVWDSRNPNDNPLSPAGEVPMSFLQYQAINSSTMAFVVNLPESAGPFTVKHLGLYARDETGTDILFSVSTYTPAIEKVATTETTTGYSLAFWIYITMTGISDLFTQDGESIVHPNPISIQPVVPSYATIPSVTTEAKLPRPATNSAFNVYHVEQLTETAAPGLAVRAGSDWNYIASAAKDTLNSFPVQQSQLDLATVHNDSVVYVDDSGKFRACDGLHAPVGIYQDGRIYANSGIVTISQVLTPGSVYYASATNKGTLTLNKPEQSVNVDGVPTLRSYKVGIALTKDTLLIDFSDNDRYATKDIAGLIKLATSTDQVGISDSNTTFAVTPKYLAEKMISQDDPKAAIAAYFGTYMPKNPYIETVGIAGTNAKGLKVTAYVPVLTTSGIQTKKVTKTYNLAWRRGDPSSTSAWSVVNQKVDGASWESPFIPIPIKMNYTGTSQHVRLQYQFGQSWNNYVPRVGDYICTSSTGTGANCCKKIIEISASYIDVEAGLVDPAPNNEHTYYYLKAPETSSYYYTYLKYYWTIQDGKPQADFDLITSYSPDSNSNDTALDVNSWTDNLDNYQLGDMLLLSGIGTVYPNSTGISSNNVLENVASYSRYRLGEVVTVAANAQYNTAGTITNLSSFLPPEPGMVLADGNNSGYPANLRTYSKFATFHPNPIAIQVGTKNWVNNIASFVAVPETEMMLLTNSTGTYTYAAFQNMHVFVLLGDANGNEGVEVYVDNKLAAYRALVESNGAKNIMRAYVPKGSVLKVVWNGAFYANNWVYAAVCQFQPGTISWVKVNRS